MTSLKSVNTMALFVCVVWHVKFCLSHQWKTRGSILLMNNTSLNSKKCPNDLTHDLFTGHWWFQHKSITKRFLTSNLYFRLKYEPINHNIALFSKKKKLFHLNQERNMYKSSTVYKQKQSKTALNEDVGGFWCERTTGDGLFHWRMRYNELWTCILHLVMPWCRNLLLTLVGVLLLVGILLATILTRAHMKAEDKRMTVNTRTQGREQR